MFSKNIFRTSLQLLALGILLLTPLFSQAQFGNFEATLPGLEGKSIDDLAAEPKPILSYASIIINYTTAAIIAIGLISMIVGAFIYITAGGDNENVKKGKKFIISALSGIVLALTAWLILNTINPQLASGLKEPIISKPCGPDNGFKCPAAQHCEFLNGAGYCRAN